jgi:hypothetical protein
LAAPLLAFAAILVIALAIAQPWQVQGNSATVDMDGFPSPGSYVQVLDIQVEAYTFNESFQVDPSWDGILFRVTGIEDALVVVELIRPDGLIQTRSETGSASESRMSTLVSLLPSALANIGLPDPSGIWHVNGSVAGGHAHIQVYKAVLPADFREGTPAIRPN